jgi:hypothetical protein
MLGPHRQTARSCADAAIGAVPISLGVSKLEVARIDARARVEEVRERLAPYAWKDAPELLAHEWAHGSRAAQ